MIFAFDAFRHFRCRLPPADAASAACRQRFRRLDAAIIFDFRQLYAAAAMFCRHGALFADIIDIATPASSPPRRFHLCRLLDRHFFTLADDAFSRRRLYFRC